RWGRRRRRRSSRRRRWGWGWRWRRRRCGRGWRRRRIADDAVLVPFGVTPMLGVLPMQRVLANLERPCRPAPRGRVCLIAFLAVIVPSHVAAAHVRMPNGVVIVTCRPGVMLGHGCYPRRGHQGEEYHGNAPVS